MGERDGSGTATDPSIAAVDSLARELAMPTEQVARVYREEASKIEADARIKTFVSVIVASRVRAELRRRQLRR